MVNAQGRAPWDEEEGRGSAEARTQRETKALSGELNGVVLQPQAVAGFGPAQGPQDEGITAVCTAEVGEETAEDGSGTACQAAECEHVIQPGDVYVGEGDCGARCARAEGRLTSTANTQLGAGRALDEGQ